MLEKMSSENQNMAEILHKKDEEMGLMNQLLEQLKPKASRGRGHVKENKHLRKVVKDKNREL